MARHWSAFCDSQRCWRKVVQAGTNYRIYGNKKWLTAYEKWGRKLTKTYLALGASPHGWRMYTRTELKRKRAGEV